MKNQKNMEPNIEKLKDIAFYARKIISVPSGVEDNTALAATAVKNLSDYGFTIDETGFKNLSSASKEDITSWYYETSKTLNELAGGNHKYRPFYPNFPTEVMEKSNIDLLIDQLSHYWFGYRPEGIDPKEGIKSLEEHPLKVLTTINGSDRNEVLNTAKTIFQNTINSKTNPSESDINHIINAYMSAIPDWSQSVKVCENRNTLSYLYTRAIMDKLPTDGMPALVTNDYLRIARNASYMKEVGTKEISNFDVANEQRIQTLPRAMRRFIANGLNAQKNLEEDVARAKPTWKALLQKIHIGEFVSCEHANNVASKLRNNIPLNTFYSRIEQAFSQKRYEDVIKMYQSRPGEFIKNFNRMLNVQIDDPAKKIAYATQLINASKDVFSRTRPEDLVSFITYLRARTREDMLPVHNVKGNLVVSEQKWAPIPKQTAETFINLAKNGIEAQIKTGQSYGKVYVDPGMQKMPLPSETKATTSSMNKYPKGARLPIECDENGEPRNVRAFVWWTNMPSTTPRGHHDWDEPGRVDLDLSFNFFKKDEVDGHLVSSGSVSYHSGYFSNGCVHSGDITNGGPANGNGATEYVDMDIAAIKKSGIDYVQMYVNSFTGQPLSQVPCLGGWQERSELDKSQTFDIKAVKQTSALGEGDVRGVTPFIFDVKNGEFIWIDSPDLKATIASNSRDAASSINLLMERYAKGDRMTMAEMIEVAVKANGGTFVNTPEEADTIFSVDAYEGKKEEQRVITSKDQDVWLGEFMSPQKEVAQPSETPTQKPLDLEEASIFDIIASLEDKVIEQIVSDVTHNQNSGIEVETNENRDEEEFGLD